jgi:hypothetical protein
MLEDAYRVAAEAIDQANERHEEIERQTVYLRALRDSTKVQVETFLRAYSTTSDNCGPTGGQARRRRRARPASAESDL